MKPGGLVVIEDSISMYPGEEFLMGNGKKGAEGVRLPTAIFGSRVQWELVPSSSCQVKLQVQFITLCETGAPKPASFIETS